MPQSDSRQQHKFCGGGRVQQKTNAGLVCIVQKIKLNDTKGSLWPELMNVKPADNEGKVPRFVF